MGINFSPLYTTLRFASTLAQGKCLFSWHRFAANTTCLILIGPLAVAFAMEDVLARKLNNILTWFHGVEAHKTVLLIESVELALHEHLLLTVLLV